MRKVRRSIALLMAVCFLFTGNVFAEGELPAAEGMPEASVPEKPTSENPVSGAPVLETPALEEAEQSEAVKEEEQEPEAYPEGEPKEEVLPEDAQANAVKGQVTITNLDVREGKFQAVVDGFGDQEGMIREVRFAVWSRQNGKDGMSWSSVKESVNGRFTQDIDIANHNYATGIYYIEAYAELESGEEVFIGETECWMDITQADPEIETIQENLEYVFHAKDFVIPGGAEEVLFGVWSEENGQDDLQWYTAEEKQPGEYTYRWLVREDIGIGSHHVDVYAHTRGGQRLYIGRASFAITETVVPVDQVNTGDQKSGKDKSETNGVPKKFYVEETGNGFNIYLKDIRIPGGEKEVLFPVRNKEDGQENLKWYSASRLRDGTYFCSVKLEDYKGLGSYAIDAYARNKDEIMYYIGNASYLINEDAIGRVQIDSVNKGQGTFMVRLAGVKDDTMIRSIKYAAWSRSDQSDLAWYTARKTWIGDYTVNIDVRNHQYHAGNYTVDCYMEDTDGAMHWIGSCSCDLSVGYDSIEAIDINGAESEYSLIVNGLEVPGGENEVLFAVWGDKDWQNDLCWYHADWWADREYGKVINIGNHRELGWYHVDVYVKNRNDSMQFVGSTSFEVTQTPMSAGIEVTNVDGTRGVFTVTMSGVFAPSGVSRVQIPMWCADDQSDICWYEAFKVAEGIYSVEMDVANHKHHFGDYIVDTYITMGNGIRVFSGSTVVNISPSNYLYSSDVSATEREVWLLGAWGERVQFPTWSNENDQDDIVWYEGTNHGNGNWSALVDSLNHSNGGDYTTHAYVTENGNRYYAGWTGYYLEQVPREAQYMWLQANMYSSPTPYIIIVDTSAHQVGVFQGVQGRWSLVNFWYCANGAPGTPTVKGVFSVGSRGYYFNSGAYRCYWWTQFYNDYLFHSVLYNWSGVLQDGRVGMALSHGCVRLEIDNAKWIYDTIPSGTTVVVY